MAVTTTSGAKIHIGSANGADSETEFEADTYTEIGEVQSFGEFGDESAAVTFAAIGDQRIRKLKGARDAGTLALVCGRDPLDAGQDALKTAEATKFEYNFKIVLADKPDSGGTDTTYYFRGLVMSKRDNLGQNDSVTMTTFNIGINSQIFEIEATAGA